ncbi:MAG: competence/damage-inducible protein A [Flavobacteriaceae bacterium]|nr:competence/damage-inducible protein A [Flavobacteriaceae bacterium]
MQAEIITIGDEILIGQIVDTNSAFISKALNEIGVSVYQITSVQDDKTHILKALKEAQSNVDIIIITGGLGPTKDDITKITIAQYFNDTLVQNKEVLQNIKYLWEHHVKQPLAQVNIDQALMPSKSKALMNRFGSAPGIWMEHQDKVFVALPGVPFEMKALLENEVLPKLQEQFQLPYIMHKTLLTYGLGESVLAARIESWEEDLPNFIKLAYLPNLGKVRLRLSAKGNDRTTVEREMQKQIQLLLPQIKDVFAGYEENGALEAIIAKQCIEKGLTLSIAESCTGGALAERLTSIAGASQYFKGSVVTYATQSKIEILKVDQDLIEASSVVSDAVVRAMANNAKRLFQTDYAIATTGNAGPTKGDVKTEIGTVYIALATPSGIISEVYNFGNHRTKVIHKAVNKAFEMLQKEISKK